MALAVVVAALFTVSQLVKIGGPSGQDPAIDVPPRVECRPAVPGAQRTCAVGVRSTGGSPLRIADIAVTADPGGRDGVQWALRGGCVTDLQPSGSCTIRLAVVEPAGSDGGSTARLVIRHNADGGSSVVQLIASG